MLGLEKQTRVAGGDRTKPRVALGSWQLGFWQLGFWQLSTWQLGLALCVLVLSGCPNSARNLGGSSSEISQSASSTSGASRVGTFRPIDTAAADASPMLADAALMDLALAGVVAEPGTDLGARMQVRPLRIPSVPRGGSSQFNISQGRRAWITALPRAELLASPAFADGKVMLGGGFASHRFFAFNAYTGELDWSVAAPDGGPTAAIVEDGKVIFNTESCTIFVADADSGEIAWSRWLGDPLMSQPAASNGLVFSAYPKNGGHRFGAFRLEDGEPVWVTEISNDVIQAPQVVGDAIYFSTMDGSVYKLDRESGDVRWHQEASASSAVWVDRDNLLVSTRVDGSDGPSERMVVLDTADGSQKRQGALFDAPYLTGQSRDRQLGGSQAGAWGNVRGGEHLGLRNVASGWAFQGSTPAVADGRAYFAISGEILAQDMGTAETLWRRRYAEAEGAQALSPPAVVGSMLVFGTVDGQLFATDIDTGMVLWAYDVGQPIVFQPIVAQGWVYVATAEGNLIGLELGDAMLDGWHMWGGNAQHTGLVETAGQVDPRQLQSLSRPGRGSMRAVAFSPSEDGAEEQVPAEMQGHELPLTGTEVSVQISGMVAEVSITQRFENNGDRPIEAVYLFPLPADSAVDQMQMQIGDRLVRGVIRQRQEARRTYEAARASGRRAALLEQQRPNLFAQRVANIMPGDSIEVSLRYVQTLPYEDEQYSFDFPMVAPRRYQAAGSDADSQNAGDQAVSAVSALVEELPPLSMNIEIDAGLPISDVESETHDIQAQMGTEGRASLHFEAEGDARGRDFSLHYRMGGAQPQATVLAHREGDEGYFTLLVQPPQNPNPEAIGARDVTFVVDTSSSMHGASLERAKAVMRRVITGLSSGDRFNVLGFSDTVARLSEQSVAFNERAVEEAFAFVDGLRATGATEMVPAIEAALLPAPASDAEQNRLPMVVLLTDGYIGNEAEVLRSIASSIGDKRLYVFGVGSSVNTFLVERAAEIGRGRAMVVGHSSDPQDSAERFANMIERPVFTDVHIDWGGLQVSDLYPRRLPDLFAGGPLRIHGRFDQAGDATVKVSGDVGGQRYERIIEVSLPSEDSRRSAHEDTAHEDTAHEDTAHEDTADEERAAEETADVSHAAQASLWARAAVHERMNTLLLRDDAELIEEVTQIGLAHHIVTPYTSFVAVEERIVPEEEQESEEASPDVRATVSPARALPGDPEIRIPAPEDARAVTVILPFGESLAASWEDALGIWSARFLIPRSADEGSYPIDILITDADGHLERMRIWYTVDQTAAQVHLSVEGEMVPGALVMLRAEQVITEADLAQVGRRPGELSEERVLLLSDARRVEVRTPGGEILEFQRSGPGAWEIPWLVPSDAVGTIDLRVFSIDMAANVTEQVVHLQIDEEMEFEDVGDVR